MPDLRPAGSLVLEEKQLQMKQQQQDHLSKTKSLWENKKQHIWAALSSKKTEEKHIFNVLNTLCIRDKVEKKFLPNRIFKNTSSYRYSSLK